MAGKIIDLYSIPIYWDFPRISRGISKVALLVLTSLEVQSLAAEGFTIPLPSSFYLAQISPAECAAMPTSIAMNGEITL